MIDFRITSVDVDSKKKTVNITTTLNVDDNSINDATVQILGPDGLAPINCRYTVNDCNISVELIDWPMVNKNYSIRINGIEDIFQNKLVQPIKKRIVFQSDIDSTVNILSPVEFETLTELEIKIEEILTNVDKEPVGEYRIDISTDQAFYNIVRSFTTTKNEVLLTDLPEDQYFIRARCETESNVGLYCDLLTFKVESSEASIGSPGNIYDPIIELDIELLNKLSNGVTSKTLIFEFDHEIDKDSLSDIFIIRRDV